MLKVAFYQKTRWPTKMMSKTTKIKKKTEMLS